MKREEQRVPRPSGSPWGWGRLRAQPHQPLKERKQASGTATLTPACLCACFCCGSVPDVRWVWQRARGSWGSAFYCHQRWPVHPSWEQGGGCQLQEGWAHSGSLFSLQVMYFSSSSPMWCWPASWSRGLLLRGPSTASYTHVHSQGKGHRLLGNTDSSAGPHLFHAV